MSSNFKSRPQTESRKRFVIIREGLYSSPTMPGNPFTIASGYNQFNQSARAYNSPNIKRPITVCPAKYAVSSAVKCRTEVHQYHHEKISERLEFLMSNKPCSRERKIKSSQEKGNLRIYFLTNLLQSAKFSKNLNQEAQILKSLMEDHELTLFPLYIKGDIYDKPFALLKESPQEALQQYLDLLSQSDLEYSKEIEVRCNVAICHMLCGDLKSSNSAMKQIVMFPPFNQLILYNKASIDYTKRKYESCLKNLGMLNIHKFRSKHTLKKHYLHLWASCNYHLNCFEDAALILNDYYEHMEIAQSQSNEKLPTLKLSQHMLSTLYGKYKLKDQSSINSIQQKSSHSINHEASFSSAVTRPVTASSSINTKYFLKTLSSTSTKDKLPYKNYHCTPSKAVAINRHNNSKVATTKCLTSRDKTKPNRGNLQSAKPYRGDHLANRSLQAQKNTQNLKGEILNCPHLTEDQKSKLSGIKEASLKMLLQNLEEAEILKAGKGFNTNREHPKNENDILYKDDLYSQIMMLIINTEQGEKVRQETVGVTSYSKDDNQLHLFNIQKESIKRIISENIAELQQRVCTITDQFLHHAVNIEDNKPSPNYNCINFEEPFTSQFLSLNEQLILKQLFSHPPLNSESISIMDKILFKISFFQNQPISARKNIIRHGSFRIYEPNQVIYNIDDEGDSLYIILMGSVYVYILDSRYSSQPILNRLLIDGDCFGEAAKSNTNNKYKRTSKIVASETTHIIELERRYLSVDSSFRKSQSQRDLLKNTDGGNFFTSVLLFFDSPLDALASLLSAVTMKTYKYGEVILKKGDVPEGLYVIYEGECIVVNDCQVAKQSKYVVSTRQGFSDYAQLMGVNPEKALGEIDNKNINNPINIPESKRLVFDLLTRSSYFGGRVLLPYEYLESRYKANHPYGYGQAEIEEERRALLSVIVESKDAKIFIIKHTHINLLPLEIKIKMYHRIASGLDADRPGSILEIEKVKKSFKMWAKFKNALLSTIEKEKDLKHS